MLLICPHSEIVVIFVRLLLMIIKHLLQNVVYLVLLEVEHFLQN